MKATMNNSMGSSTMTTRKSRTGQLGRALLMALTTLVLTNCTSAPKSASPKSARPMTREEKIQRAIELFSILDTNNDGVLSREEMSAGLKYMTSDNEPNSKDVLYGLTKSYQKVRPHEIKHHHLSAEQIKKMTEEAFRTPAGVEKQEITKESFKKIVVGPSEDVSSIPNPWEQLL
jgi:Ca2+-binding EF-hand superfamily protein